MQPTEQCVAYWLDQGSPNYGLWRNFVIDEKTYLRKYGGLVWYI